MNSLQDVSTSSVQSRPRLNWVRDLPTRLFASLERARTRRLLAQLNDHQLSDLGISHADRVNEMDKPFWR
ncbi:DUF1127 domain-containing protein [Pseudomonas sp. A-B-19]|uniref:DUF1127 domain-containing protein n=1 Tax=Pseudomonas sp. A-B-19 TaxID=2832405 RepID=UPI001CBCCE96|nr:DUF1127 domain-containing protein [Pseudomonas sp. A-B-19]